MPHHTRVLAARIKVRTDEIEVGKVYFLSSFGEREGAMVRVIEKSHKINSAGWPSTVTYKVIETVGGCTSHTCAVGYIGTCNATNLYERREDASIEAKMSRGGK